MKKGYQKEDIILLLKHYFGENNGVLNLEIYNRKKYRPSETTIRKKFGSWNQALEEAGLPINRIVDKWYGKEDVLKTLRSTSINGFSLTVSEYKNQHLKPNFETVISLFGSWNDAVKASGLKENRILSEKEETIKRLQEFANDYPNDINSETYEAVKWKPSYHAIKRQFGSWLEALKVAGLTSTYHLYSDDEIYDELMRCMNKIYPQDLTMETYRKISTENSPNAATIARRFGKWSNAKEFAEIKFKQLQHAN